MDVFRHLKTNDEIFNSIKLLPNSFSFQNFIDGWNGSGRVTYATYFLNTFLLVLPTVIFTIVSSCLVAYGFARFKFPGKNILFALFSKLGWINNYMPFYAPAILACYPFFVYMLIQFLRGIPKDLDESAYIDGCGTFRTLVSILLPLMKPALFSAALFQFLWTYNDYFNSLIFINSGSRYTISLALRLSLDSESVVNWGKLMAISFISVTPLFILFFAAQKYFVEGIATSGLKG